MLKGIYKKPKPPEQPTLSGSIDSVMRTVNDVNNLKSNVQKTLTEKIKEVDSHIENAGSILEQKIKDVEKTVQNAESTLENTVKEVIDYVQTIKQGEPGKDVDHENVVKDVLSQIPEPQKIDEKALINRVISQIPENKPSLKVIRETITSDPMAIVESIMSLPDGKFKLKTSHIDGLDQTIQAFKSQLKPGVGYLHGGGDTVTAGTNITITTNPAGQKVISSTASASPLTTKGDIFGYSTTNARIPVGSDTQVLTADSSQPLGVKWATPASSGGTVTSISIVSANGFAGSVSNPTTTPAITLTTTITGLLKGDGTSISAASAGTDYQAPITLTTTGTSGIATFIANTLNIPNYTYTLPTASTIVLGGVKVDGTSITISGGVISAATSGGGTVTNVASADGSILVTNPTTTVDLAVVKAPILTTARTIGGVSFNGSANITVATATGGFTVSGGDLAIGANNLTITGSIGSTGSRVTKGWFTDLQVTNAIVGSITGNAATATALATPRTIGTLTGDATSAGSTFDGSANNTNALTLATVNTNTGSWGTATQSPQFTVNGKGLITAAANVTITPAISSITGLGTGIATFLTTPSSANLAAAITDETGSGALVFATSPVITLNTASTATTQTPSDNSTKIATTAYVDAAVLGQNFKEAALVATTANLVGVYLTNTFTYTATGTNTIDGVTLALGNRVLVKNQTTTFQNGIYTVTTAGALGVAGVLTRAPDANTSGEFKTGDSLFVSSGTANSNTTWAYTGIDSPTLGTDAITFAQTAGQGTVTAGNGITVTGLSVAIDTSITVDKTTAQTLTNKTIAAGSNTITGLTNSNLSGSAGITNANLANSAVTIGSTSVSLGATVTTFVGLVSVTSTTFVGALTGNASTATALQNARTIGGVSFDGTTNITVATATGGFTISGGALTLSTQNLVTDTTTGTKIGTATNQKLGFFNATPIVQPTGDVITALQNLGLGASLTVAATTITARTLWGQTYDGSGNVSGSLTAVGNITGGASSMTITAGTGNSRTLALQSTTSGGVATTFLTGNADQTATFASGGTFAGNVTIGTGNAFTAGTIELGAASDTTLSRVSAGVVSIEGVTIDTASNTLTLTNKTLTSSTNVLGGVTMTLGSDASYDIYYRESTGVLTRLGNGTTGQFLAATTGAAPSWGAPAASLTVGTSAISGGTTTRILYDNAGVLGEYTISGSGTVVAMASGATLTTATVNGVTLTTGGGTTTFLNANGTYSTPAGGGGLTVGTTTITSGTTTRILYDNAGVVGEYTLTGTGTVVAMQTAPSFLTSITTPSVLATSNGSGSIGASGTAFSNLFLASGGVINFNAGNATITHSAALLTIAGGGLTLAAGTTSLSPLNFQSGTNLTTATAGAMEFDGKVFYSTPVASARGISPSMMFAAIDSDFGITSQTAAQPAFPAAYDVWTLAATTTYFFEGQYLLSTGTVATQLQIGFVLAGGASITSIAYTTYSSAPGAFQSPIATSNMTKINVTTVTSVFASNSTIAEKFVKFSGIIRVNAGGTFTPSVGFSVAPTGTNIMQAGSYIKFTPIGVNTVTKVGNVG